MRIYTAQLQMIMKIACLAILVAAVNSPVAAQNNAHKWGAGLSGGIATFSSMKKLSSYHDEVRQQQPFDGRIVKSFPTYLTGAFHIVYVDSTIFFDVSLSRTTTGSRLSYSDYSGVYSHDLVVVMGASAASVGFRVLDISKIRLFAGFQALLYSNVLKEKLKQEIYDGIGSRYEKKYGSTNIALGPLLEAHRRINTHLLTRLQTSYEFHAAGAVKDDDENLVNQKKENVTIQAGGLRVKIGLIYLF